MKDYFLEIDEIEESRELAQKEKERDESEPPEKGEYKFFGDGRKHGKNFAGRNPRNFKPLNRRREGETKSTKRK